jgi:Flp pilus assembly pilin Flp
MKKLFRKFVGNEDGAVTVDWVVLCAGIVAMALAIYSAMERGGLQLAADTSTFMDNQDPN